MTELRERLLAPCLTGDPNIPNDLGVDVGAVLTRLLLFERYVIDSSRLREFPSLLRAIGLRGVELLLESGFLEIHCDALTVGSIGQLDILKDRQQRGILPLGSFSFGLVSMPDRKDYIHGCLHEIQPTLGLSTKQAIKLKRLIVKRILELPEDLGVGGMAQLRRDLAENRDVCRTAIVRHLHNEEHLDVPLNKIDCKIEQIADGDFRVETNLQSLGLDLQQQHQIVERALLAVGGLNLRLDQMEKLGVISGIRDGELPIFDSKIDFLRRQLDPEVQVERFHRILTLTGMPDPASALANGETIDIEKLLKVRESPECRDFRVWLRTIDTETDKDIQARVNGLKAKVAEAMQSKVGRVLRFGLSTGAGFIPGAGIVAGPAVGAVDSFVIDKLFGEPGPAAFLSHDYRSVFGGS